MKELLKNLNIYQNLFPLEYLNEADKEDLLNIYLHLDKLKRNPKSSASFKGDIERFFLHRFSFNKLSKRLNRLLPFSIPSTELIKIVFNKEHNFMLTTFYNKINSKLKYNNYKPLNLKKEMEIFIDNNKIVKELDIDITNTNNHSIMTLKIINVSSITSFRNLVETIEKNNNLVNYIKIWIHKTDDKRIKTYHKIDIHFNSKLDENEIYSLKDDFERYLQHYIKPMSVFDMIGPSMIGPSSSHTAGANRIGHIARNFFISLKDYILKNKGKKTPSIAIKLYSSFADTGLGHKTPNAIGAGLLGYKTDSKNMTEYGKPDYIENNFNIIDDIKIIFAGYKIEEKLKTKTDNNQPQQGNIAKVTLYLENEEISITGYSIGGGNVEIRYINDIKLADVITGKENYNLKLFLKNAKVNGVINKIYNIKKISKNIMPPFNTMEEFLDYQKESKKDIIDIILELEYSLQFTNKTEIYSKLENYWNIMKESIIQPLKNPKKSDFGLTGADAKKISDYNPQNSVFKNDIFKRAVFYSTSVNEFNAQSGLIVACPTAGSAGIVPGVLKAYQEITLCNDKKIWKALLVSGFLGMILFNDVTTAGADFGCQAEIGSATAMGAAAITYLENGSMEAIVHAFTLAIKNSLGLVCDPVGGLVEVPCVKRNGIYSSMALSSALMALSGVRSFISPDEVILAMQEIGNKLNKDYKETARGGLAKTRDGKEINIKMRKLKQDFFGA